MNKTVLKLVVLSISFLSMATTAASPALGDISKAFPEASSNTIMLIVSLPALLVIPFTLLCGKLSSFISKRNLLFIGLALFLVGGVGPSFFNNLTIILAFRAIFGIGMGFIMPLSTGLIADFFEGKERGAMMGYQSAIVNIGGVVTSLIAGFLSAVNWHYTFYVYLLGVGVLLFTFLKLPEPEKIEYATTEKMSLSRAIYGVSAMLLLYSMLLFSFFTNTAMLITSENLGNAASAGIAITAMMVGGLVAGIVFGKVFQSLKQFTIPTSVIVTGSSFVLLSYAHDFNLILVAALVIGIGFGTTMPCVMIKVASIAPQKATTFALAIAMSAMSLGQFLSPIILSTLGVLFGNTSGRFTFLLCGAGILIGGVIIFIKTLQRKKVTEDISDSY